MFDQILFLQQVKRCAIITLQTWHIGVVSQAAQRKFQNRKV